MKTLEQILKETKNAKKDGEYGIDACKKAILEDVAVRMQVQHVSKQDALYDFLKCSVNRVNDSVFANPKMVQACWQLINER